MLLIPRILTRPRPSWWSPSAVLSEGFLWYISPAHSVWPLDTLKYAPDKLNIFFSHSQSKAHLFRSNFNFCKIILYDLIKILLILHLLISNTHDLIFIDLVDKECIYTYLGPLFIICSDWISPPTYLPFLWSDLDLVGSEYIYTNLPPLLMIWFRRSVIEVTTSNCLSSGTLSKWVITTTTGHPGARACMLHSQGFRRSISEVPPLMLQTTWNQSIHQTNSNPLKTSSYIWGQHSDLRLSFDLKKLCDGEAWVHNLKP